MIWVKNIDSEYEHVDDSNKEIFSDEEYGKRWWQHKLSHFKEHLKDKGKEVQE